MKMASKGRRAGSCDADPYSPSIAEELMEGLNEWRHVPDIVRLTLKSISDVIQTQGAAIRELERQMPGKASKSELAGGLNSKANLSDITHAVHEASTGWKDQCDTQQLEAQLSDKVSRAELSSMLRSQLSEKEIRSLLEQKVSMIDFEGGMESLREGLEDLQKSNVAQMQRLAEDLRAACQLFDRKADVSDIEKLSQGKANRQSVISALQTKVSMEELENALRCKADIESVDDCLSDIQGMRQSVQDLIVRYEKLMQEIRVDVETQRQSTASFRGEIASIRADWEQCREQQTILASRLDEKTDIEKISSVLRDLKVDIGEIEGECRADQTALEERISLQVREVQKQQEKNAISYEARLKQLQETLLALSGDLVGKCEDLERKFAAVFSASTEAKKAHSDVLSLVDDLNSRKADTRELREVRRQFAEMLSTNRQESEKQRESLLELIRRTQSDITRYVDSLCSRSSPPNFLHLQKELSSCVRLKDLQLILDGKTTSEELSRGLQDLRRELGDKVTHSEFCSVLSELKTTTETILLENTTGRWLWTSGSIKADRRIPWEVQTVNMRPDNFIWENGQFTIYTVVPGLYEVALGVFARGKPKVQLFVNDQSVYRLGCSDSDAGKQWGPHADGNLVGQTLSDVIALPTRARIFATYEGEWRAEAFFSLRKL